MNRAMNSILLFAIFCFFNSPVAAYYGFATAISTHSLNDTSYFYSYMFGAWQSVASIPHSDLDNIYFLADAQRLFVTGSVTGNLPYIALSTDFGYSWTECTLNIVDGSHRILSIDFSQDQYGFAMTDTYLLRSINAGATWTDFKPPGIKGDAFMIDFLENGNSGILLSYDEKYDETYVYSTEDPSGENWTLWTTLPKVSFTGLTITPRGMAIGVGQNGTGLMGFVFRDGSAYPYPAGFGGQVAFVNDDFGFAFGEEGNLFVTADGGGSWKPVSFGNYNQVMNGVATSTGGGILVAGTGEVLYSVDGINWVQQMHDPSVSFQGVFLSN